jgi:hypothetical protein
MQQVAFADETDHPAIVHDRNPADAVLDKQPRNFAHLGIRPYGACALRVGMTAPFQNVRQSSQRRSIALSVVEHSLARKQKFQRAETKAAGRHPTSDRGTNGTKYETPLRGMAPTSGESSMSMSQAGRSFSNRFMSNLRENSG